MARRYRVEIYVVVCEGDPVPRPRCVGRVNERRVALAARTGAAILVRALGREDVRIVQARAHERAVARGIARLARCRALEALLDDEDDSVEAFRPRVECGQCAVVEPVQRLGVRAIDAFSLARREHVYCYSLLLGGCYRRGEQDCPLRHGDGQCLAALREHDGYGEINPCEGSQQSIRRYGELAKSCQLSHGWMMRHRSNVFYISLRRHTTNDDAMGNQISKRVSRLDL